MEAASVLPDWKVMPPSSHRVRAVSCESATTTHLCSDHDPTLKLTAKPISGSAGPATSQYAQGLHHRTGELMPFIKSGKIAPDDVLIYTKRNGETYRGVVSNDGWIRANENTYSSPSGALKACLGHDVNGWKTWTHQRTGQLLDALRK